MNPRRVKVYPLFFPLEGCPHRCIYCAQDLLVGHHDLPDPEQFLAKLEEFANRHPNATRIAAYYGGTFTALPDDKREAYLAALRKACRSGFIHAARISTRPDMLDESRIAELKGANVDLVELGVQSLDDEILAGIGRNYNSAEVFRATRNLRQAGIGAGYQLMVGLPGETEKSRTLTLNRTLEAHPEAIRINPTLVFRGTRLEKLWQAGKYEPLSLEEAIEITSRFVRSAEAAGIRVLRIGLHTDEALMNAVVAGPAHPRFGTLVRDSMRK